MRSDKSALDLESVAFSKSFWAFFSMGNSGSHCPMANMQTRPKVRAQTTRVMEVVLFKRQD